MTNVVDVDKKPAEPPDHLTFPEAVALWIRKKWWDKRWHHMTLCVQGGQRQDVSMAWWASVRILSHCPFFLLSWKQSHYVVLADLTWPGTHFADQVGLELTQISLPGLLSAGIKEVWFHVWTVLTVLSRDLYMQSLLAWVSLCRQVNDTQRDPFSPASGARMMGHRTFVLKDVLE